MKYFFLFFILSSGIASAQLKNSVEVITSPGSTSEETNKKELLFEASLKSIEKYAPELGYSYADFLSNLNQRFEIFFGEYQRNKFSEKFGANFQKELSSGDKSSFIKVIELQKREEYIKFSGVLGLVRSYSVKKISKNPANALQTLSDVDLELDKTRLERLLRRIVKGEIKPFSKIILISEINPYNFSWNDLGLDGGEIFLKPINDSWMKWLNDNIPNTVEEAVLCDRECMNYHSSWVESQRKDILFKIPPDYANAIWLKISIHLQRTTVIESINEMNFQWEGRVVLQDVNTKRIWGGFEIPMETRAFRRPQLKDLNSDLASQMYRAPMGAFVQLSKKLIERPSVNHVSQLIIKGHRHLSDAYALIAALKGRGSPLGMEIDLDYFTRNEAVVTCFYQGEEKSFTDLLSGLKELKSSQRYVLVNEFDGVHHIMKMVIE